MDEASRVLKESDPALRAAVEWALELDSPDIPMDRVAEWQRWLNQHPRHAHAFERIEKLLGCADRIRAITWPTRSELAADDYDGSIAVSAHARAAIPRRANQGRFRWILAAAASVVLALGGLFVAGYPRSIHLPGLLSYDRIETRAGGTQKVVLADGSAIDVSGQSTLRATLTRSARDITLESGEAFFRVAKDAQRPFIVRAGSTAITAVGTAFNVRRAEDRVVVAVSEGAVQVTANGATVSQENRLHAGEQAYTKRNGAALEKVKIDVGSVAGWRDGRLQYLEEPLVSVAADVGRNTGRQIRVADASLGQLHITSTVLEHNLDGWLKSLEEAFPVMVIRNSDGSITLAARSAK